jgi:phage recombination protein Bet
MNTEEIAVLKRTIAKGCNDDEFALFLQVCMRTRLDPFAKQICPVARWDKKENRNVMQIQVQIDGFRVLAQRTGEYGGSDSAVFDEGLSLFEHLQTKRGKPQTCTATVYRIVAGHRCSFTSEIAWNDFYPGEKQGFMWNSKPYQMLAKAAESQALRKAFQLELSNLVTPEEIDLIQAPTRSQALRSDDWFDTQRQFKSAATVEAVNELVTLATDRNPVGDYEIQKVATIAKERIAMTSPVIQSRTEPVKTIAVPTNTIASYSGDAKFPSSNSINYFRSQTNTVVSKLKEIATRLELPLSSAEMNGDETIIMVAEILAEWAVTAKWIDRDAVNKLIAKSIERTSTDSELWTDFDLSIEAFKEESIVAA